MVQLTCNMIQLANVSQTVGGPLASAKAFVFLAIIHPRVYEGCARVYGEQILWRYRFILSTHASWYKYIYIKNYQW